MKKVFRDIVLIVALFGAILLAPLVMDALPSGKEGASAPKTAPAKAEVASGGGAVTKDGMPPQPMPEDASDGGAALDKLSGIDDAGSKKTDTVISMTASNCPETDVGGQQDYDPKVETRQKSDTMIMPAATTAQGVMDGNGGVDTLKITDGGEVDVEGKHLIRFEIYDLRNGKANVLRVFAAGLASMNGRHAIVIGDREGDAVLLDPCLRWNDPIAIDDGPEPLLRYDAHDSHGNPASVSVTEGVRVEKQTK